MQRRRNNIPRPMTDGSFWRMSAFLRFLFSTYFGLVCLGRSNVPRTGGVIICPNHSSSLDTLLIGATTPRRFYVMGKQEHFRYPVLREIRYFLGAFPVKRGHPDVRAIRWALKVLSKGSALLIFPEGTRSRTGKVGKGEPGAAFLAIKCRVPVVPVAIVGSYEAFPPGALLPIPGRKIYILYGRPLNLWERFPLTRGGIEEATEVLMEEIRKLWEGLRKLRNGRTFWTFSDV